LQKIGRRESWKLTCIDGRNDSFKTGFGFIIDWNANKNFLFEKSTDKLRNKLPKVAIVSGSNCEEQQLQSSQYLINKSSESKVKITVK
jgi:hypothetical protein